jgi:hypothetical protein
MNADAIQDVYLGYKTEKEVFVSRMAGSSVTHVMLASFIALVSSLVFF